MARVVPEQEPCSIPGMEFIYVTQSKIRYINTEYKKMGAKMYDHNCDIKLKVADTSFKAHKEVLSEASDYFAAMFSHDMQEKEKGVIELHDLSPPGFSVILDYFYHGHVTIDRNTVADVLEAARFFHVQFLIDVCCEYLVRHLSLDDYEEVLHLEEMFSLGNLKPSIFKFLSENLLKLVEDPNSNFFKNLSMDLLSEFLRQDIYYEVSEGFLVSIILQWVETEPEQRKEHLVPLLRLIRFPLIELEDLESLPAAVIDNPEIQDAVEEAKQFHFNIAGQSLKSDKRFLPRGAQSVLTIMSFQEEQNMIIYKHLDKKEFMVEELSLAAALETDFEAASLATVGNYLYAVGGYDENVESSKRIFRFDPRTREWLELAAMSFPRVSAAIVSTEDRIFVLGGIDHHMTEDKMSEVDTVLDSFEMYNAADNGWITLATLPKASYAQAAAVAGEKVYISGGISGVRGDPIPLRSAFKFSLAGESWEPIKDMLVPRQSHSMTHHNNRLFVIGGFTSTEDNMFGSCLENEVFDIETEQWSKIMTTPEKLGHIFQDAVLLGNLIYFVGGIDENRFLHSYDIEADKMEEGDMFGGFIKRLCLLKVSFPPS